MHIITNYIRPDEPCEGGWEGYEQAPVPGGKNGETGWRWLQKIWVYRDDTIAKYVTDLGPAEDYEGRITPIALFSNGQDDVATVLYYLEKNRHDTYWQTRAKAQLEESRLVWELVEQQDKLRRVIHNRTSSGPYVTVQRNDYAHEQTMRDFKDRRRAKTGRIQL